MPQPSTPRFSPTGIAGLRMTSAISIGVRTTPTFGGGRGRDAHVQLTRKKKRVSGLRSAVVSDGTRIAFSPIAAQKRDLLTTRRREARRLVDAATACGKCLVAGRQVHSLTRLEEPTAGRRRSRKRTRARGGEGKRHARLPSRPRRPARSRRGRAGPARSWGRLLAPTRSRWHVERRETVMDDLFRTTSTRLVRARRAAP